MKTELEWKERREALHEAEWQMRERLLRFVDTMMDRWEQDAEKFGTLEAVSKLIDCASKLGRQATEEVAAATGTNAGTDDFMAALSRIDCDPANETEAS